MNMPTIRAVCMATIALNPGVNRKDLKANGGQQSVYHPRQDAMAAMRQLTGRSFPEIARLFGGKHHTTVMHGINRATKLRPGNVAAIVSLSKKIIAEWEKR